LESSSTQSKGGFKNNNIVQAWLVILLSLCFGSALAAVQAQLSDTIAANKLNETLGQVPALIWGEGKAPAPDTMQITPGTVSITKNGQPSSLTLYRVAQDNKVAGWVAKADGQGYGDKVELLIGVDPDVQKITGLFVLEQKETPGLGNRISEPQWRNQFVGKSTAAPLHVVKGKGEGPDTIDAITGATISSRRITAIVNNTVSSLRGRLDAAGKQFTERSK
jgi:Na+-translocating ferredoxin:NAD+ oxidoreductase subunit G